MVCLFGLIFDVGRVNIFCVSRVFHSATGPFLLLSPIIIMLYSSIVESYT